MSNQLKQIFAYTLLEIKLMLRRGENLLLTIFVPAILLLYLEIKLKSNDVIITSKYVSALKTTLVIATIASAFTSNAISVGFDKRFGILKRVQILPLQIKGYLFSKILATYILLVLEFFVLSMINLFFTGYFNPLYLFIMILVSPFFVILGLFFAGVLKAETNLALVNTFFIILSIFSGINTNNVFLKLIPSVAFRSLLNSFDYFSAIYLLALTVIFVFIVSKTFKYSEK